MSDFEEAKESLMNNLLLSFAFIGLTITKTEALSLVNTRRLRDLLICKEYDERRRNGEKAEYLYCEIGERYCLNYKTIWDIVHHRERKR